MKICPQCGKAYDDPIQVCPSDRSQLILFNPSDDPMLGKLIDDRYRLIRKIGEGGMGAIYRAVHVENLRVCAIKLMTGLSPGKDDAIARFKREARNSVRIDSAHAVTVYDSGQTDEGLLFLAMEFIDGKPLSRVIAEERVLPIERVIHITNQIAEALAAAHSLPMIHRDLKPDNIMITRKGSNTDFVKVLDFGIAKALADSGGDNLTKTGFVLGTPVYMSPEQLLGEELDPRSDIYSLAIIVYEMLSGRLPFEGDNPQAVMMKRVMSEPIRLRAVAPTVSESVEVAVMAGLTRNREARPQTVEAFASTLSRVTYSGTQIMGGAVTGQISASGEGRATAQFGGQQTRLDSSPAFTGQSQSSATSGTRGNPSGTSGTRGNPTPFPPTEITQAATKPQQPDPPPETRVGATPMFAAPVTVRDLPPTPLADPIVAKPERRTSKWIVLAGVLVLAVIAAIVYIILRPPPEAGFALLVRGAPAGSQVFINDVRRDSVPADGGLRISGIDPGSINVRVSREGFTDYATTVNGNKGETQTCEAQLLPASIDYSGPMVAVAAGDFVMGDDNHEADERPAHNVTVAAFYIDKYEVSNAEYKKFCDATGRSSPANPGFDPNYFAGKPDYPVLGVTFEDALAYASWAGKRLPTEQEWEKAASWDAVARRKRQYTWGDQFTADRANIATGHPVPTIEATGDMSPYGVFNMAGNALEWVDAPYGPYEGNRTPDPDFLKGERVIRGGTFVQASKTEEARGSFRNHGPRVFPTGLRLPVGIRCVISANDSRIQSLLQASSR
jgi:serine/threonine protein kinase/formylglycine-generating enzyme required for sulfatase activity